MEPLDTDPTLYCRTCGATFTVVGWEPRQSYRCGRCDLRIQGPGDTPGNDTPSSPLSRYLYGRRPTVAVAEGRRFGRYILYEELGRGGMGVVYRAWDADRAGHVALKVLLGGEHSAPEHVERFLREARAASGLDHPSLVRVYDLGWVDDRAYFTMDLVDGPSLQELLEQRRVLPIPEALRIASAVARALGVAHDHGMIHRDVKPGNILLETDGTPVLTDFGLAADLHGGGARLTRTGQVMGTPAYMAPEQLVPERTITPATDQYGLGAVLYEMLAGTPPYPGEDAMSVLQAILTGPPRPIRERVNLPRPMALVLETAMAREPERRYRSAVAFADDLDRCRLGEAVEARPPTVWYRIRARWRQDHRVVLVVFTAGLAALLAVQGVTLIGAFVARRTDATREAAAQERFDALDERVVALRVEGRDDAALTELARFASDENNRGTVAGTAALLEVARIHTELSPSGRTGATTAWAAAYGGARRSADQDVALRGLAGQFHQSWQWDALASVVDSIVSRNPGSVTDPGIARWRAEAQLARRNGAGAVDTATAGDLPDVGLLRALAHGTPVPGLDGAVRRAGSDLWVSNGVDLRRIADAPGFPEIGRTTLPRPPVGPSELFPLAGSPPLVLTRHAREDGTAEAVLYALDDGGEPEVVVRWPEAVLLDAVRADVDRDGVDEVWVGVGPFGRHLVRLANEGGRWVVSRPLPGVDATASDVSGTGAVDLDGDGYDELILTVGPWSAYDVRVWGWTPDGLVPSARRKLGYLSGITPSQEVGRFWVARSDLYPSRVVFPPGGEYGEPAGVYALRLEGGELVTDRFLPSPLAGTHSTVGSVLEADLDGDGLLEVVFSVGVGGERQGLVVAPSGDPQRSTWVIDGASPVAVVDGDDDVADELLVHFGDPHQAWVIGLGDQPLPADERPGILKLREPVPTSLPGDAVTERAWLRSEDLVGMGLAEAAIDGFVAIADSDPTGPLGPLARSRAARISEARGDDLRAAALYTAVADRTGDSAARASAAANHLHGHRFAEALAVGPEGGPEIDAVAAEVGRTRTESWTFDGPLPAPIEVLDPIAVRVDPRSKGLAITSMADDTGLLRIPFQWSGGRLGLDVDLVSTRLEWSGGIRFALRSPTDTLAVELSGWGGGELLERDVRCVSTLGAELHRRVAVPGPEIGVPMRLSIDLSEATGDIRCAVAVGTEPRSRVDEGLTGNLPIGRMPVAGEWELIVEPTRHGSVDVPAVAAVTLRSLAITGTDLQIGGAAGPLAGWTRQVASGVVPDETPAGTAVWRAVALADAGQGAAAAAQIRSLGTGRRDPVVQRELTQGLRSHLPTFGPVLFEVVGLAYYPRFQRAFEVPIFAHPDDAMLTLSLTTGLPSLESAARVSAGDPVLLERLSELLAARGRAWATLGQPAAARRDLMEATRIGTGREDPEAPRNQLAAAWTELAALAASEGNPVAALEAVRHALEVSAAPEITGDIVRARPELSRLAQTAEWAAILP